jgi:hypothetical protein
MLNVSATPLQPSLFGVTMHLATVEARSAAVSIVFKIDSQPAAMTNRNIGYRFNCGNTFQPDKNSIDALASLRTGDSDQILQTVAVG